MTAPKFINANVLATLFKAGRFQKKPTLVIQEISSGPTLPPEALIGDREDNMLGSCWISDLETLLTMAAAEGDTVKTNANLLIVQSAVKELRLYRARTTEWAADIERRHLETVVPFPSRPPVPPAP